MTDTMVATIFVGVSALVGALANAYVTVFQARKTNRKADENTQRIAENTEKTVEGNETLEHVKRLVNGGLSEVKAERDAARAENALLREQILARRSTDAPHG